MAGFRSASQSGVTLTAGQSQQVNFNLSLGETTETVEVTGSNSLLDTGSANIATTLRQQEVTGLPNEGRNPYVMATLAVGVVNGGSGDTSRASRASLRIPSAASPRRSDRAATLGTTA